MHEHMTSNQQHPTQQFHKNLKNVQKPQNLCLKCMNAWKMKV